MAPCTEGRLKQRKPLSPILEAEDEVVSTFSSPRSKEQHNDLLDQYMDLKAQVGDMEESLLDHLLNENENLRQVNERQSRELRYEHELRLKAEKERAEFRVEYLNFKLSLTMEHAELQELKQTLEELTISWENEKRADAEQKQKLEQELNQLRHHHAVLQRLAPPLICQTPAKSQANLPVVAPPAHPKKAHRPYTGKTKSRAPCKIQPAHNRSILSACGDSMKKTTDECKATVTPGKELRRMDIKKGPNLPKQPLRYSRSVRQNFPFEMNT